MISGKQEKTDSEKKTVVRDKKGGKREEKEGEI